ncbi:MAG: hypothetical protein H0X41_11475, partial [Chitinophagaceae bacterium]|nr:hypothetical protein [Chitinophagaceae bacterium]
MQHLITVTSFQDLEFTLLIKYTFKGKHLNLIVDKQHNTDLMEWYQAPLSQYAAIMMCAMHEEEKGMKKYLD